MDVMTLRCSTINVCWKNVTRTHTYGEEKLADIAKLIPHSYDVLCAFLQLKGKKPRLRKPQ